MSQATIGNLRATLGLDSAQFEAGAKRARSTLAGLKSTLTGFAAGVAGALSLSQLTGAAVQAMRDVAQMGDLAETIGITAEQVQAFNRIALASGASTDVMARGLQSITEQTTQADSALSKLFAANGFSAGAMNAQQAIMTFMDLLQRARTPAEQLQMATAVLGDRVGRELVESMRTGAAGFDEAMRAMVQSGAYHTNAEVSRIQEIETRYNELTARIQTEWQSMIVAMVSGLDTLVAANQSALEQAGDFFSKWKAGQVADNPVDMWKRFLAGEDPTPRTQVPQTVAPGKGDLWTPQSRPAPSVLPPAIKIDGSTKKTIDETTRALNELKLAGQRVWEDTRTPLERYQLRVRELNDLLQKGAIDQETYNRAVAQAQDEFSGAERAAEGLSDTIANDVAATFEDWIGRALDGTFELRDALGDLAKQAGSMLIKSGLQGLFGGLFGGGGILGGLFGGFTGLYAKGGTMGPGEWGIAGEAGPEIVTGPATITPMTALSGGEVHVILHPSEELWAQVDSKVMEGSRQAVRVSVAESGRQAQRSFGTTYRDNQVRKF